MENIVINSIEDARRYAITLLNEEIADYLDTETTARRENIPVDYHQIYQAINRMEKIIEHHKQKLA